MSYSFNVVRGTKADLALALNEEFDKVVASQPVHKTDIGQAEAAAKSLLDLMEDDPAQDLSASVSGSISMTDEKVLALSVSVNLQRVARAA